MSKAELQISGLHYYPIKSCGGTSENSIEIGESGIRYDRFWMVVDKDGIFVTQRQYSKMALVTPQILDDKLIISAKDESSILEIPLKNRGKTKTVQVWDETCEAVDDGYLASQWFSDYLGAKVNLVHMNTDFDRVRYGSKYHFADSAPLLITTEESLNDLNYKITTNGGEPVPMNRFRPNIVVKNAKPYEEDGWKVVKTGSVEIELAKPCIRCPIPQIDQATGEKGKEPTRTLLTYRRISKTEVIFAQKAFPKNTGKIRVGAKVSVVSKKDRPTFLSQEE